MLRVAGTTFYHSRFPSYDVSISSKKAGHITRVLPPARVRNTAAVQRAAAARVCFQTARCVGAAELRPARPRRGEGEVWRNVSSWALICPLIEWTSLDIWGYTKCIVFYFYEISDLFDRIWFDSGLYIQEFVSDCELSLFIFAAQHSYKLIHMRYEACNLKYCFGNKCHMLDIFSWSWSWDPEESGGNCTLSSMWHVTAVISVVWAL